MLWLIPVVVGFGALMNGCSRAAKKPEIKSDPSNKPLKQRDLFEKCFPNFFHYHLEMESVGTPRACAKLAFNKDLRSNYPWGPMPWKVKGQGSDFQWTTEFLKTSPPLPNGAFFSEDIRLTPRQRKLVFQGTLYSDCSFDFYMSKGLFLEGVGDPDYPLHYYLFYPRKDGVTCQPESRLFNVLILLPGEGPECAKFPSRLPPAKGETVSSLMRNGKDCLKYPEEQSGKSQQLQMKLVTK